MSSQASSLRLRAQRRSATRRLWHDTGLPADLVEAIWNRELDRILFSSKPLQVKDRCIAVRYDHADGPLLLKRHLWGGVSRTLRSVGRESSARTCARLGLQLATVGIPTPLPRACFEQSFGPWGTRSYLVTDFIEGESLYRLIRFGTHSEEKLRHLAQQVAMIWRQMVDAGISHNDMKPENFMVDADQRVWLIDLEKVRIGERRDRQWNRSMADVANFLHVRSWHRRLQARQLFHREFLNTAYGAKLPTEMPAEQQDPELSVWVVANGEIDIESLCPLRDSIQDIADELMIALENDHGEVVVCERMELSPQEGEQNDAILRFAKPAANRWRLVLQPNEIVTPFLAKELQQRISENAAIDALRIPIEPQYFGRSVLPATGNQGRPVRLVREELCRVAYRDGQLVVETASDRVRTLTGLIQQSVCSSVDEYIAGLNAATSSSSEHRFSRGDHPSLTRAVFRAASQAIRQLVSRDGLRSGRAGIQRTFLDAVFHVVEEFKLLRQSEEFLLSSNSELPTSEDSERLPLRFSGKDSASNEARRAA